MLKIFFTSLGCLCWSALVLLGQQNITFSHDGLNRTYHLYVPETLPDDAPLVFVLHGYMQTNDWCQDYLEFDAIADTAGFVVCYPQGTQDFLGFNHWNSRLNISSTDDIGFLSALAVYLQETYDLDPNRTYSCGFSNGGYMSYTLACEVSEIFRAIGSVSGTMSGDTWDNCSTTNKSPVIQFHGIDDDVIPIEGRPSDFLGWGGAPRIRTIVDYWSDKNQCSSLDSNQLTSNTKLYKHGLGAGSNEVWYYEITDHGHEWPGSLEPGITDLSGIHASMNIWQFFKQFGNQLKSHSDIYLDVKCLSISGQQTSESFILKGSLNQFSIEILDQNEGFIESIETSDDILVLDPNHLPEEHHFIKFQSLDLPALNFQVFIK